MPLRRPPPYPAASPRRVGAPTTPRGRRPMPEPVDRRARWPTPLISCARLCRASPGAAQREAQREDAEGREQPRRDQAPAPALLPGSRAPLQALALVGALRLDVRLSLIHVAPAPASSAPHSAQSVTADWRPRRLPCGSQTVPRRGGGPDGAIPGLRRRGITIMSWRLRTRAVSAGATFQRWARARPIRRP